MYQGELKTCYCLDYNITVLRWNLRTKKSRFNEREKKVYIMFATKKSVCVQGNSLKVCNFRSGPISRSHCYNFSTKWHTNNISQRWLSNLKRYLQSDTLCKYTLPDIVFFIFDFNFDMWNIFLRIYFWVALEHIKNL